MPTSVGAACLCNASSPPRITSQSRVFGSSSMCGFSRRTDWRLNRKTEGCDNPSVKRLNRRMPGGSGQWLARVVSVPGRPSGGTTSQIRAPHGSSPGWCDGGVSTSAAKDARWSSANPVIRMILRFSCRVVVRGRAFAADMDTLVATPIGASPRTKRMEQVLALEGAAAPTVVLAGGRYPWRAARPVGHIRRARPGRGPRPPRFARGAARARGRRLGRPITGRSLRPRPWPDPGSSRPGTG